MTCTHGGVVSAKLCRHHAWVSLATCSPSSRSHAVLSDSKKLTGLFVIFFFFIHSGRSMVSSSHISIENEM